MDLEKLRETIDRIDEEMLVLLRRRKEIAKEISKLKMKVNGDIYDKKRETEIIDRIKDLAKGNGLDENFIGSLYKSIIHNSRKEQENDIIKKNK